MDEDQSDLVQNPCHAGAGVPCGVGVAVGVATVGLRRRAALEDGLQLRHHLLVREAELEHHAARGGLVFLAVGVIDEVALRTAVGGGHFAQMLKRFFGDVGVAVGEHIAGHVVGAAAATKAGC